MAKSKPKRGKPVAKKISGSKKSVPKPAKKKALPKKVATSKGKLATKPKRVMAKARRSQGVESVGLGTPDRRIVRRADIDGPCTVPGCNCRKFIGEGTCKRCKHSDLNHV
jgi:hypothetical protein